MQLKVLLLLFFTAVSAAPKRADFDIYSSLPLKSSSTPRKNNVNLSNISTFLSKVGSIGGIVYIGIKVWETFKILTHNKTSYDELIDVQDILSNKTTTNLSKIQSELDDLWRIVHDINYKQNERLTKIELIQKNLEQSVNSEQVSTKQSIINLTDNIQSIRQQYTHNDDKIKEIENTLIALSTHLQSLSTSSSHIHDKDTTAHPTTDEFQTLKSEFLSFQRDSLPRLLKERDDVILEKLKKFGENVKKIISSSTSSAASKKTVAPPSSEPKPKK